MSSTKTMKRSKEQRESDMNILSKMYIRNKSQMEIGRTLGISQGQVSNDLKKLLKRWEDTRLNDIDQYKAEQLQRINHIEGEMWTAWELSKTKGKITISKSKSGEMVKMLDPSTGREFKMDDDRYWKAGEIEELPTGGGDMQYMNGIMWCVQERSKIMGLNAPKKIAATDPTGTIEAGQSAKEILGDIIGGILKRAEKSDKELIGSKLMEIGDNNEIDVSSGSVLAQKIRDEKIRRLPPAKNAGTSSTEENNYIDAEIIDE